MSEYYNLESVREMAGGDEDFVGVIVQTFLEEIPPDVEAMSDAIDNRNPTLAYQYAHKMKPNLQLFGLELMDEVRAIEDWSKSGGSEEKARSAGEKIKAKVNLAVNQLNQDF